MYVQEIMETLSTQHVTISPYLMLREGSEELKSLYVVYVIVDHPARGDDGAGGKSTLIPASCTFYRHRSHDQHLQYWLGLEPYSQ